MNEKLALVAMSGGVDSSVAAALMAEAGWKTVGVTLKITASPTGFGCCGSPADIDDAKRVCESLGLAHYTLDMAELFERKVVKPFIAAYLDCRTPNPCVECNKSVKFGQLMALAQAWGADCLATGHYARSEGGRLFKADDRAKDQSYFLYSLTSRELARACFPLGRLRKSQVREKARELGLKTAEKPESQEICFVPNRDYRSFIAEHAEDSCAALTPGPIQNTQGEILGQHRGLASYTRGQRRGLGIATPEPSYVLKMDSGNNALVVGPRENIFSSSLIAHNVSWISGRPPEDPRIEVRIRHRHAPAAAEFKIISSEETAVQFAKPQPSIAPGQAAVFYSGDEVLGGGTIAAFGEP